MDLTDTRLRLIITKNSAPRNREENILFNIIEVLTEIQNNYTKYNIRSNDQFNMVNYIYQNQNIKFDVKQNVNGRRKRLFLDEITEVVYTNKANIENIIFNW